MHDTWKVGRERKHRRDLAEFPKIKKKTSGSLGEIRESREEEELTTSNAAKRKVTKEKTAG